MKKLFILAACSGLIFTSCVSNKKYAELEAKQRDTQDRLNTATVKLNSCEDEKAALVTQLNSMNDTNRELINQIGNFTDLTKKGAKNLEMSLESLKEKDLTINKLRDALTRRDSVNLALVQSLKGVLGNMDDTDIEISVDKGVVIVNISDKLLFRSGSYTVTAEAREVLGKVAQVVNNKPDFEFIVEGHTDDVPYRSGVLLDNWDLSVLRATSVVRTLQNKYNVAPEKLIASGRSSFHPIADNNNWENRAKNRRTRIVILPNINKFFALMAAND